MEELHYRSDSLWFGMCMCTPLTNQFFQWCLHCWCVYVKSLNLFLITIKRCSQQDKFIKRFSIDTVGYIQLTKLFYHPLKIHYEPSNKHFNWILFCCRNIDRVFSNLCCKQSKNSIILFLYSNISRDTSNNTLMPIIFTHKHTSH